MKQRVSLAIEVDATWRTGTRLQLYTDWGTGTIDATQPLLARAAEVWPGYGPSGGFAVDRFGERGFFDGLPPIRRGFFDAPFALYPFCEEPAFRRLEVLLPAAYANWSFAAKAIDLVGNEQDAELAESEALISGTQPPAVHRWAFESWDNANSQITFMLVPGVET